MFCQKCGSQLAADAKFCGTCGTPTDLNQPNQEAATGTSESNPYQPPRQDTSGQASYAQPPFNQQGYAPQPPYTQQQGYAPQPPYGYQQPYGTQRPYTPYGGSDATPRKRFTVANAVILAGAILAIIGFFLPLVSSMGMEISLMDVSFGTGLVGAFDVSLLPLVVFLVAGILALIFAFTKPGLGIISAILEIGGFVYLFVGTSGAVGGGFSSVIKYAGIGFYLTAISTIVILVGSIMGFSRRR